MGDVDVAQYIPPVEVHQLQAYQRKIVSDQLHHRHPYLEDIRSHLKTDEVSTATGARLFPRLVEQLESPKMDPEKLSEALRTVCDLCSHQESKASAVSADIVTAATNLLMHDSIEVRREAARVIECVTLMVGGRSRMPMGNVNLPRQWVVGAGTGPTLPRLSRLLLGCPDEVVKANVAAALRATTVFRDGCQQVLDHGAAKAVAQYLAGTLPHPPETQALSACLTDLLRTLAAVTMYANQGMRDVFGINLIGKIVGFLDRVAPEGNLPAISESDSAETVRQALRVLWHCGNDARGRKEALKANGVEVVTKYLEHPDPKVREGAICVLNVLALEIHGKQEVLKHSVVAIAELLHSTEETKYLHETCVQLARCASELPAFRFTFAKHVLESVWLLEKIYGTTAISALCGVLTDKERPELRTQAAVAIAHFLRQAPAQCAATGDKIRVPPVSPLEHINAPPMYAIEECTGILFQLVALLQDDAGASPALDCLDALTDYDKPRGELQEIVSDGRLPEVPEQAMARIKEMLGKTPPQAEKEPKQASKDVSEAGMVEDASATASKEEVSRQDSNAASGKQVFSCPGETVELVDHCGEYSWQRVDEEGGTWVVTGTYDQEEEEPGRTDLTMRINSVRYIGADGEDDVADVVGEGCILGSVEEDAKTLSLEPCAQFPDLGRLVLSLDGCDGSSRAPSQAS